jgi:hypothetical protein
MPDSMPTAANPVITRTPIPAPGLARVAAPVQPKPAVEAQPKPGEQPKPEAKTEEKSGSPVVKPASPEQQVSQRLALIARREAALVQKQRSWQAEIQRRETALKNQEEQISSLKAEVDGFKKQIDSAKGDPIAWLKLGGHDYDGATKAALNDGKLPPEELVSRETASLRAELEKIRKEQQDRVEAERKSREEQQKQAQQLAAEQQQQAFNEFVRSTVAQVKASDKFPLLKLFNRELEVPQLIDAHFRQTAAQDVEQAKAEGRRPVGRILSTEEAAQYLESYYREQAEAAGKLLAPKQPEPPANGAAPASVPQTEVTGQRPTLSNTVVAQPSPPSGQRLSAEERYQRALAALNAPGAVRQSPTT